jgi:hypothetical protein
LSLRKHQRSVKRNGIKTPLAAAFHIFVGTVRIILRKWIVDAVLPIELEGTPQGPKRQK